MKTLDVLAAVLLAEAAMDGLYDKVIALVLLFPWTLIGLTLVGYLRGRGARKAHPA